MQVDELIRQLRAPDQRNMGRIETAENGADNIDRLASLDATAQTVRVFDATVIPGNLQTPAYSEAIIRAAHPHMGDMEIHRRVRLKDQRGKAFLRGTFKEALHGAWFVIGERAITQCLSETDEVHAVQLRHILMVSAHEKIVIQVLPDSLVTPGLADQFSLYGLDDEHRVGYVETIMGAWYSTRLDDVAKLHSVFSDIARDAMSPQSTRSFIREVLSSWRSARKASTESTEESRSSSPRTAEQEMTALESPRAPWRSER